ncbi:helix-turn-helix domain-containing protein [Paenibacillus piri]|uniref:AraC family transcriptional regulator n=1 Tax=Paenibacillus piri TaxID=2547395 RepID=A0A4R5KHK5_9BACL|nr:AraC family transcriptional regulator [Paenibacillus piri]
MFKDKSLTISEIAGKVGYGNDDRLIRVFKKYKGITPGKYREQMEGGSGECRGPGRFERRRAKRRWYKPLLGCSSP